MQYKQKLQNLEFRKANGILTEQTLNFGKQVVITSAFIILLSLNIISINSIEFEGITITIETLLLIVVLSCIDLYFYLQFSLSVKVDLESFTFPEDLTKYVSELGNVLKPTEAKQKELEEMYQRIINETRGRSLSPAEWDKYIMLASSLQQEIHELGETILKNKDTLNNDAERAKSFLKTIMRYNTLNIKFPQTSFFLAILIFLLRIFLQ